MEIAVIIYNALWKKSLAIGAKTDNIEVGIGR